MDGRIVNIPESVSLALHALKMLVSQRRTLTSREIADLTGMSANHLSKVMRRLVVSGIVCAAKGPNGGFYVDEKQKKRKLVDVYLAFEQMPADNGCLYRNPICDRKKCVFGGIICRVNRIFFDHFNSVSIGELYSKPSK